MNNFVRYDLGLKSLAKQQEQLLTPEQMDKRKNRDKHIHNFLKN